MWEFTPLHDPVLRKIGRSLVIYWRRSRLRGRLVEPLVDLAASLVERLRYVTVAFVAI